MDLLFAIILKSLLLPRHGADLPEGCVGSVPPPGWNGHGTASRPVWGASICSASGARCCRAVVNVPRPNADKVSSMPPACTPAGGAGP